MPSPRLLVVHPTIAGESYRDTGDQALAWRLLAGFEDVSWRAGLCSSREVCDLAAEEVSAATLIIISPFRCLGSSGNQPAFLSRVATAHKRILASLGPVEDPWYEKRFTSPIRFDAVFDLGFVSQADRHRVSDVPYHFVFNGLTSEEERILTNLSYSEGRCIPWALVGDRNQTNFDLLAKLLEHQVDPGGFCFLHPRLHAKNKAHRMLSGLGLSKVLSKTSYYLWASDYPFAYYESLRFVYALLAGAVPCKIDSCYLWENVEIPNIFPSVRSFQTKVQAEGYSSMYSSAREFYVPKGRLAEHLEKALHLV